LNTSESMAHSLYLIPTPLGKAKQNDVLPEYTVQVIHSLNCFVVENVKNAIGFLKWIGHPLPDYKITFRVLNKKTPQQEVFSFVKLLEKNDVGLLSDAGAPAVADPGATLVKMAHDGGHRITPLTGPSSILLALMASGLNGQNFAFNGYLPIHEKKRKRALSELELESRQKNRTQIFMETPHRNPEMYQDIISVCHPETKLCIASELTLSAENIETKPVYEWRKKSAPELKGIPALFLIYSGS